MEKSMSRYIWSKHLDLKTSIGLTMFVISKEHYMDFGKRLEPGLTDSVYFYYLLAFCAILLILHYLFAITNDELYFYYYMLMTLFSQVIIIHYFNV